jgi:hypothetical protein
MADSNASRPASFSLAVKSYLFPIFSNQYFNNVIFDFSKFNEGIVI